MASTIWKGYISFGLISIPIRLFAAARDERIGFNQIHEVCGTRIKQQLFCPTCERVVQRAELVKGHEYEKGRFVVVEDEELKKIAPASTETMEILEFVKLDEVDPLYFDSSYYAIPENPGKKPYALLVETMEDSGYAAIAKIAMHQREYTVLIRPRKHGLTLHTMFYENEVRDVEGYGDSDGIEVKPQEVALAKQLIETLAAPFDPEKYSDTYQERVAALLEAKKQGQEIVAEEPKRLAPVIDLMEALQASLKTVPRKAPVSEGEEAEPKPRKKAAGD